uniref:Retrovirus-related Pol polyprotein from transposon TNT 1-94 n=1 Tax=Tanacetum cinerariifolium TaxID=118510 RepID=A0A6L2J5C7_TANCI|nr:retrovirus-related Pol polyprotein from transposon TNT 1-94 [Tanacetum cinerariifolium]
MAKFKLVPKRLEEEYHVIKDDTPFVNVYTTRKVTVNGMLILENLITDGIRDTQEYKHYVVEYGMQKPISTPIPPLSDDQEHDDIHEATLLSLFLHKTAKIAEEQENMVAVEKKILEEDVDKLIEEPGSHKENPEIIEDDDEEEKKDKISMSIYARAMIELRVDIELKDNIMVAMPKITREGIIHNTSSGETKNLKKISQALKGILVGQKVGIKPIKKYRHVPKKHTANSTGNKKKGVDSTNKASDSNHFKVLNSFNNDMDMGTNGGTSNLDNNGDNSSGSSFWNVKNSSISTTPITDKIGKFENLVIDGQAILVDEAESRYQKKDEVKKDDKKDNDDGNDDYDDQALIKTQRTGSSKDARDEDIVIDEDEVIPEDETLELIEEFQNVDKRVPTIIDHERIEATLKDMMKKPNTGLIYLNNKNEKILDLIDISKFCDATLVRVLKEAKLKIFKTEFLKKDSLLGQVRVVKCYNCQGEGHMARQCTKPKRLRNFAWFKEKMLLVQAQRISSVKTVFNQMEDVVEQCSIDKKYFDIQKKEFFLDNNRLLEHIIFQDVMNIVMHADSVPFNVLPVNTKCLVHDNLAIERLEQENDHLFELFLSQDIVHIWEVKRVSSSNYQIDLEHADKVLSMHDDELELAELKEVVEVVTTAKLMTKVVTAAATITAATTLITAATIIDAPSATRKRKRVVIRDPEETATPSIIIHSEPKSKDKGKGIMDDMIEQVQRKEKEDNAMLREYLEVLWRLVKERFASSKPKKFSDDFLLTTLTYMFEKPDVQAQVWKNQRSVHNLAMVKSWRLLESCGVHIITFTTTQMILLVEIKYPLTSEKGHYARNCPKPRIRDSKYFMEHMLLAKHDEARVILTDEQNDFLLADALRMEEIKELRLSATFSVRRPSNRDSSFKNSVVSNTKNSSKTVEVSDRTNKKLDVASKNIGLDMFVTNDEIKTAIISKNVLCVSYAKNVLIPCHDNCLVKYKSNVHSNVRRGLFNIPRIVKSTFKDTTPVVSKTRLVNRVHKLDFARLTEGMRQTLAGRLRMVYTEVMDMSYSLVMHGGDCLNPWADDLEAVHFGVRDFLGPSPSYVYIRDPMRRMCHRMIVYNISGRRQAPEKYQFRHVECRKSGARLFGGHFIGHLAAHFGLVSDEGLRERQSDALTGAPEAVGDAPAVDEGALAVLAQTMS